MCKVYLCRCMCADCLGEGHTAVAFSQQVYFSFPPHPQQSTCSWLKVKVKVWVIEISTIASNIKRKWEKVKVLSKYLLLQPTSKVSEVADGWLSILKWLPGLRVKKISVCWNEWVLCIYVLRSQAPNRTKALFQKLPLSMFWYINIKWRIKGCILYTGKEIQQDWTS